MSEPHPTSKHPSQRRYPPELRERAVRMVLESAAQDGESQGVITRVAMHLDIGVESLRLWVKQYAINSGFPEWRRAGLRTAVGGA